MKCPYLRRTTVVHALTTNDLLGTMHDRTETRTEEFLDCLGEACMAFIPDRQGVLVGCHCRRIRASR